MISCRFLQNTTFFILQGEGIANSGKTQEIPFLQFDFARSKLNIRERGYYHERIKRTDKA
jgi:hypothetical protein